MTFHVLTLFPQMINEAVSHSVLGRAVKAGLVNVNCVNIRDFAVNKHGQVDDAPYGGGAGMVLMAPPVCEAYRSLHSAARVVYLSPQGRVFNQLMAARLAHEDELILLCGHYEGIDERIIDEIVSEEISIGDFVLTGGEPAALAVIDAVSRLLPGVLGKDESSRDESFSDGLLEYPQYTRPPEYRGRSVPAVLLSGHHKQIDAWRRAQSLARTREKRPDLLGVDSGESVVNTPAEDVPVAGMAVADTQNALGIRRHDKEDSMILQNCEPASVFRFFEEISNIPRGSGNEQAVSDHIAAFARGRGLTTVQDERNNLVIYKAGTPGYENHPPLILQGHMDMVCEKNKGTEHDFLRDPLKLRVDGDYVTADGTTLGADNGIAVALAMALLERDDLAHPPLEILLTTDEEAGMSGAEHLDASLLKGRRMINLDTVSETTFFTGCAGGAKGMFGIPAAFEPVFEGAVCVKIDVKGLKGGHSGEEILCERGNSIRILARVLQALNGINYRIAALNGGMKLNAIPREAEATLAVAPADIAAVEVVAGEFGQKLKAEYRVTDPGLTITVSRVDASINQVLTAACGAKAVKAGLLLPYGVLAMSGDISGLVETSNNVGSVDITVDEVLFSLMPRSSVDSRIQLVKAQINALGELMNARVLFTHEYPAWEYDPASELRKAAEPVYREVFKREPVITAVHAGLECGILSGKIPGLDIISFGPNADDLHTPDERLSISSTARVWEFLIALLKTL